jgi:hypothetical protein
LLVDPTPGQFHEAVRQAVAGAYYQTGHIPSSGPLDFGALRPFPRPVTWASMNTPAGHWQTVSKPSRTVRRYGIAWHVDQSDHRHIRVFGVHDHRLGEWMPDPFAIPPWWGDDPPAWAFVYPNFPPALATLFKAAGQEWQAGIYDRPNDWLWWLVLADHLDEQGQDASPIRRFFQGD